MFTAAQAAQKVCVRAISTTRLFTAAQAAQKSSAPPAGQFSVGVNMRCAFGWGLFDRALSSGRCPEGAGLNPVLQAQRVALGLKPALRWLKCAAVRRWIAQLGSFARVVDGVVSRPVRSVARGG